VASSPVRAGHGGRATAAAGWVRRWYGASPLHLLALLAAFALAGYAVRAVIVAGQWTGFALWFAVAIIGHDLLLFPLYSLADLSLRHLLPGGSHGRRPAAPPAARGPFEAYRPAEAEAPAPSAAGTTSVTGPIAAAPAAGTGTSAGTVQAGPVRGGAAPAGTAPPAAGQPPVPAWPPLLNYVRIPVIFSLLLLMTFFPMILGLSEPELHRASGLTTGPYLWRWLGVTGVMFTISAAAYALRTRHAAARARQTAGCS